MSIITQLKQKKKGIIELEEFFEGRFQEMMPVRLDSQRLY